jgi:acetolactate decarboxylase
VSRLDRLRDNNTLFAGLRLEGQFERMHYRVACRAEAGTDLVSATSHQAEFQLENVSGTLVGFWTPSFARTINVPGYHLHLLSDDRQHGGHVLDLHCRELKVALHREDELHLALPETPDFLKADLSGDPAAALAVAESKHS